MIVPLDGEVTVIVMDGRHRCMELAWVMDGMILLHGHQVVQVAKRVCGIVCVAHQWR